MKMVRKFAYFPIQSIGHYLEPIGYSFQGMRCHAKSGPLIISFFLSSKCPPVMCRYGFWLQALLLKLLPLPNVKLHHNLCSLHGELMTGDYGFHHLGHFVVQVHWRHDRGCLLHHAVAWQTLACCSESPNRMPHKLLLSQVKVWLTRVFAWLLLFGSGGSHEFSSLKLRPLAINTEKFNIAIFQNIQACLISQNCVAIRLNHVGKESILMQGN